MTGNSVLLDTNIVIDLFKGDKKTLDSLENFENIFIAIAYWLNFISVHTDPVTPKDTWIK